MKIRLIGYAGSGKTSMAISIQEKYAIQGIALDDYLKIKNKEQRQSALNARLDTLESWVVEGVQVSQWTKKTIVEAELIVILDYPLAVTQFRVFKRAVKQVFDKKRTIKQKKKVIKRMFKLFKWNRRFKKRLPNIKTSLYNQPATIIILETPKSDKRMYQYIKRTLRNK